MSEPTIVQLLAEASAGIGAVGKDSRNIQQNYNFRSHDAVVAACAPIFRRLGIVVVPRFGEPTYEPVTSKGGAEGWRCYIPGTFEFHGPAGDSIEADTYGEAIDYGDKSTNKAMSAAFKYVLTQTLCLPTHEEDADAASHEVRRGAASSPASEDQASSPQPDRAAPSDYSCPSCAHPVWDNRETATGRQPRWKCSNPECTGGKDGKWPWAAWDEMPDVLFDNSQPETVDLDPKKVANGDKAYALALAEEWHKGEKAKSVAQDLYLAACHSLKADQDSHDRDTSKELREEIDRIWSTHPANDGRVMADV